MRIALCQIDPTVGAFADNAALVVRDAERARAEGARIALFPELCLCGYPPRDLLDRPSFIDDGLRTLEALAGKVPPDLFVLVGFVDRSTSRVGKPLHNAMAVLEGGRIARVIHKRLLPTYDVFDEDRYFEPGAPSAPFEVDGVPVGLTICEDAWNDGDTPLITRHYAENPIADLVQAGARVLLNASGSPFTLGKLRGRGTMMSDSARRHGMPLVFVNQVGGNDDLLFDGESTVFGDDGSVRARLAFFAEDFAVVDTDGQGPVRERPDTVEGAAFEALVAGVRDYARKCGFGGAVLGLSGGIDSALTACIAAKALGPDRVLGLAMPTRFSSEHSLADAEAVARALGIDYRVVSVDPMFQAALDGLGPELDAICAPREGDVTFENVQARIRCQTLMAVSNRCGHLLLTTGNKSEIAVGYCTLYGDMAGGLAVISDVPKTFVYRIAREVNRLEGREVIPKSTLDKPPSAELRADQRDEDSLPPYAVLDPILERYIEDGEPPDAIIAAGFDEATVRRIVRMVHGSEYKRRQMPPGLILTRKAFGPGRRYPIAQGYRH